MQLKYLNNQIIFHKCNICHYFLPSSADFAYFGRAHTVSDAWILIRFCVRAGLGPCSSHGLLAVIDKVRAIRERLHFGAPAEAATVLAGLRSGGSEGVG